MIVTLSEPLGTKQPRSAHFPRLDSFTFNGSMVVGHTAGGPDWLLAEVVNQKSGMIVYRMIPETYAAFHNCPKPDWDWLFYNLEGRG